MRARAPERTIFEVGWNESSRKKKNACVRKGGNQHYQSIGAIYLFFGKSGIHVRVQCALDAGRNRRRKDRDRPDLSILYRGESQIEMVVKPLPPVDRIRSQNYPLSTVS